MGTLRHPSKRARGLSSPRVPATLFEHGRGPVALGEGRPGHRCTRRLLVFRVVDLESRSRDALRYFTISPDTARMPMALIMTKTSMDATPNAACVTVPDVEPCHAAPA